MFEHPTPPEKSRSSQWIQVLAHDFPRRYCRLGWCSLACSSNDEYSGHLGLLVVLLNRHPSRFWHLSDFFIFDFEVSQKMVLQRRWYLHPELSPHTRIFANILELARDLCGLFGLWVVVQTRVMNLSYLTCSGRSFQRVYWFMNKEDLDEFDLISCLFPYLFLWKATKSSWFGWKITLVEDLSKPGQSPLDCEACQPRGLVVISPYNGLLE